LKAVCLILALGASVLPVSLASAQTDPAVRALIRQLVPLGGGDRGIRLPSSGNTEPASRPSDVVTPSVSVAPPPPRAESLRTTTAPAGMPAASIMVNFPSGSAQLTPVAEQALAPLGVALSRIELSDFRFRIEGHTDRVGPRVQNQTLSERRAESVRDFLIARFGVDPQRIEVVGRGEDDPLVVTADEISSVANRRVQVMNLGR